MPLPLKAAVAGCKPWSPVPPYPIDVAEMSPSELECVRPHVENVERRGEPFHFGRRPFETSAAPTWRASFESFAPLERPLGAVFRKLLRNRGAKLGVLRAGVLSEEAAEACLDTAIPAIPIGLDARELRSMLGEFASDLPVSVASALCFGGR